MSGAVSRVARYTHQWRRTPMLQSLCMASVDSHEERTENDWRTFRVRQVEATAEPIEDGEILCPASAEQGHRLTCEQCGLCRGTSLRAKDIAILPHDNSGRAKVRRLAVLNTQQGELFA